MTKTKNLLIFFFFMATSFLPFTVVSAPSISVWFTQVGGSDLTADTTPIESALLHQINNAENTISLSIYDFNRDSIRDALILAKQRGVIINVVTDDEARKHIASYIPYYQSLENAGIAIVDDNRAADIHHNKFAVFDESVVWTGSMNWSDNGVSKNANNGLVITNTAIAQTYLEEFNQMFVNKRFSIHKTEIPTKTFSHNGIEIEVHFSPKGNALDEIIQEVNSATDSIHFAVFFFTSDELRQALIKAHRRGVQVTGIWDNLGASNAFSDDEHLCEAGIQIKIENWKGKNHHKYIVIDALGANPKVVTGSMNLSTAGNEKNDENTLIIKDALVANQFMENWTAMYNSLPADTGCLTEIQTNSSLYLPMITNVSSSTPLPVTSSVKIARIVYNPVGNDLEGELIEITNSGDFVVDLTGWLIRDAAETQFEFPAFSLASSSSVIVWVKTGINDQANLYWNRGATVWNNTGDTATLLNNMGNVVDSCTYDGSSKKDNVNCLD